MWASWGGAPTTHLLRLRDPSNNLTLRRLRAKLEDLVGYRLPTKQEEKADPDGADREYERAVSFLREATRDRSKFPLVFSENTHYGFRRNLWGLKTYGVAIASLAAIGSWAMLLLLSLGIPPSEVWLDILVHNPDRQVITRLIGSIINTVIVGLWIFVVKPQWVKVAADAYAERLLASIDSVETMR